VRVTTGAIHVIPAHLAGESNLCRLCIQRNDALSEIDRGDTPARQPYYTDLHPRHHDNPDDAGWPTTGSPLTRTASP
jgi:hypothetical protein